MTFQSFTRLSTTTIIFILSTCLVSMAFGAPQIATQAMKFSAVDQSMFGVPPILPSGGVFTKTVARDYSVPAIVPYVGGMKISQAIILEGDPGTVKEATFEGSTSVAYEDFSDGPGLVKVNLGFLGGESFFESSFGAKVSPTATYDPLPGTGGPFTIVINDVGAKVQIERQSFIAGLNDEKFSGNDDALGTGPAAKGEFKVDTTTIEYEARAQAALYVVQDTTFSPQSFDGKLTYTHRETGFQKYLDFTYSTSDPKSLYLYLDREGVWDVALTDLAFTATQSHVFSFEPTMEAGLELKAPDNADILIKDAVVKANAWLNKEVVFTKYNYDRFADIPLPFELQFGASDQPFFSITVGGGAPTGNVVPIEEDLNFTSQQQFDDFAADYGAYDAIAIAGDLIIGGDATTSVQGLSNIISVQGSLVIANDNLLANLAGLSGLTSVGGDLRIESTNISNIDGLSNLTTVGQNLLIDNNDKLINLDGLSNLTTVGRILNIDNNDKLINLDGLSNLTSVGRDIAIENNLSLISIDGLSNVPSAENIWIYNNSALTNIDGLSKITMVIGLDILNNKELLNIDGLFHLATVASGLKIHSNEKLANLDGLYNLTAVGRSNSNTLWVFNNPSLTDCGGLGSVLGEGVPGVHASIYLGREFTGLPYKYPSSYPQGMVEGVVPNGVGANSEQECLDAYSPPVVIPVARCQDVQVLTDPGACSASASVDAGSDDPDGDPINLMQSPHGPYWLGTTDVTLTVSDNGGTTASCQAMVTIQDQEAPVAMCNSPETIVPPDAPISFTAMAEDQCAGPLVPVITEFDCFKFTKKGKRIDKTGSCVVSINGDTVTIHDSGGVGDHIEWTIEADDGNGNTTTKTCSLIVVKPGKGR